MRTVIAVMVLASVAAAADRPQLAMIIAEDEYKTAATLPLFAKTHLDSWLTVTVLREDAKTKHHIAGLDRLSKADALLLSVRRKPLLKADIDAIRAFVASGKPVIAIRTSSHAFAPGKGSKVPDGVATWESFDTDVLGCKYGGHTNHKLGTKLSTAMIDHPILKGVPKSFASAAGLYKSNPLAKDCIVLLTGQADKLDEPVAWVRDKTADRGRVAYIALGHESDFAGDAFPALLTNAIRWALTNQ
jgi:type 1 glutamine amidotransferase